MQQRSVRAHVSHTDAPLFFFSLTYLPSFKYLFSFLFKLGSTQGNEFLYEVKYEISGTELLMHFYLAPTMAFPRRRVCVKFFLTFDVANFDRIFHVFYLYRTYITASIYVIQIFSSSSLIRKDILVKCRIVCMLQDLQYKLQMIYLPT